VSSGDYRAAQKDLEMSSVGYSGKGIPCQRLSDIEQLAISDLPRSTATEVSTAGGGRQSWIASANPKYDFDQPKNGIVIARFFQAN